VNTEQIRTTCECIGDDAYTAAGLIRRADTVRTYADESHYKVTLIACPACGGAFLRLFTELTDFHGGEDSQTWITVPLTEEEGDYLRRGGDWYAVMNDFGDHRRHLAQVFPRTPGGGASWETGSITILPHD